MTELKTDTIPLCFMQAGFRLAPRYTINGEPKRLHGWQQKATTSMEELQGLLQEAQRTITHFQDRDIATPQDRIVDFIVVPPKKFCIIDIDNKNDKNGSASWLQLQEALAEDKVTPTVCVKTKSGGYHYYFRSDVEFVKSVANFAGYKGVDVRGPRGHVILPYRVGPENSWQAGEYLLYQGDPREQLPLFKVSLISKSFADSEEQLWMQEIKEAVGKLEPVDFVPEGARDNLLWDAACILYRKGISRQKAEAYITGLAKACQPSDDMNTEAIIKLGLDKIDRVFRNDRKIVTVIDFERELGLGGLTRIANDGPTKYFFEYENIFKMDPKATYSKESMADIMRGVRIVVDDGEKQKVKTGDELLKWYIPEQTVYGIGFYPDSSVKIYKDQISAKTLYNIYEPAFTPETAQELIKGGEDMYPTFVEFLKYLHPYKWEELLSRIAWTIQFPQLKMVSLAVYISEVQGVGKDVLASLHGLMIGPKHYKTYNSIEELTTRFADMSDSLLINIAEAQMGRGLAARNKMTELRGIIKTLTTQSVLKSERKNVQADWRQNFTNFVMTTNEFNPNLLEHNDRRHEIFIFPSTSKLDQTKFGKLADLSKPANYPTGKYPRDKLASIWWGLKNHVITKRYHIDAANDDEDKQKIFAEGISPVQGWLITELPDIFSKDFVIWFLANFYPQRDRIKPMDEAEYFFNECKNHIQPVRNTKGSTQQKLSLTRLHRITAVDGKMVDLQRRTVSRGPGYYQYLHTIRNHGHYDNRHSDEYYQLEEQLIKFYKNRHSNDLTNDVKEDVFKILSRFQMAVVQ